MDRSRSLAFHTCPSVAYAYDMCSLTSSTDRHGARTIGCLSLTGNSIDRSSGLDRPRICFGDKRRMDPLSDRERLVMMEVTHTEFSDLSLNQPSCCFTDQKSRKPIFA